MAMFSKFAVISAFSFGAMLTNAQANPFMSLSGPTSQPIGHFEFCQRLPNMCNIVSVDTKPIHLEAMMWSILQAVNSSVNERIKPATDLELYGKQEYWTYPTDSGDCEDYVLEKQKELNALGLPISSLLITVVRKPNGEGHAVLTVRSDRGDFILDNLHDEIRNWRDTNYIYLKRQSVNYTGNWVSIEDRSDIVVGAVADNRLDSRP